MTLVAIWLGITVDRARRQKEAVARFSELGLGVMYDYYYSESEEPRGPAWLRNLIGEDYFCSVVQLHFNDIQVSAEDFAHVSAFRHLEELYLEGTSITDADAAHLRGLTSLTILRLRGTQVTDEGLRHLKNLTALQKLDLRNISAV